MPVPNIAKSKAFVVVASLALLIGGAAFASSEYWIDGESDADSNSSAQQAKYADAIHVSTFPAGSIIPPETYARYRGTVTTRRESLLGFRRGGRVERIRFHEGDSVAEGQILATLDTSDLQAERKSLEAQVDAARAALDEAVAGPRSQTIRAAAAEVERLEADLDAARTRLGREGTLRQRGAGTDQSFDDAKFAVDRVGAALSAAKATHEELIEGTRAEQIASKRASLAIAEAALERIDVDFEDSQITAPYDGTIAQRMIDEGTVVASDTVAMKLIEAPPLEARFGLPNQVALRLQVGDSASVETDSRTVQAMVKRIHPTLSLETRTRAVDVSFDRDAPVVAGETVALRVSLRSSDDDQQDSFWVPISAMVRSSRGLWSLMIAVNEDDDVILPVSDREDNHSPRLARIQRRDVRVLRTTGAYSAVVGMVEVGDDVVFGGSNRIGPGVRVWTTSKSYPMNDRLNPADRTTDSSGNERFRASTTPQAAL